MPCQHKFYGNPHHLANIDGLLPNWTVKTLIIGTFNPEIAWVPNNSANYFYGRSQYFWNILPRFAFHEEIDKENIAAQFDFLHDYEIGLTDLLIEINDADINIQEHIDRVMSYRDNQIELFGDFHWNTNRIINFIQDNQVEAIYFTKLGNIMLHNPPTNSFEFQMRIIENFCQNNGIYSNRLHTPSGQGLGAGVPRRNVLINRWFHNNGGNDFPFLSNLFDINEFIFI